MNKEEIIQAIRALSNIEWVIIANRLQTEITGEHFDYIMEYLSDNLK